MAAALPGGGRVVAEGTASELKRRIGGYRLELVAHNDSFSALRSRVGGRATGTDAATRSLSLPVDNDDAAGLLRLLDDLDPQRRMIARFTVHSSSLDDVFLALTSQPKGLTRV